MPFVCCVSEEETDGVTISPIENLSGFAWATSWIKEEEMAGSGLFQSPSKLLGCPCDSVRRDKPESRPEAMELKSCRITGQLSTCEFKFVACSIWKMREWIGKSCSNINTDTPCKWRKRKTILKICFRCICSHLPRLVGSSTTAEVEGLLDGLLLRANLHALLHAVNRYQPLSHLVHSATI
jgi:hypothetical protein